MCDIATIGAVAGAVSTIGSMFSSSSRAQRTVATNTTAAQNSTAQNTTSAVTGTSTTAPQRSDMADDDSTDPERRSTNSARAGTRGLRTDLTISALNTDGYGSGSGVNVST